MPKTLEQLYDESAELEVVRSEAGKLIGAEELRIPFKLAGTVAPKLREFLADLATKLEDEIFEHEDNHHKRCEVENKAWKLEAQNNE
jgi:hypothetical protein